ncbi:MAG: EVE domain-containing protein [Chloroflexota bacterium]
MNYWIFKSNVDHYRLDDRLKNPDPNTTWKVTRYREKIQSGDLAFIWRAGNPRGICAIMEITTDPLEMEEIEIERQYGTPPVYEVALMVKGNLVERFSLIESKTLKQIAGLENLSVFHGFQQGTNFPVTKEEGRILHDYIGGGSAIAQKGYPNDIYPRNARPVQPTHKSSSATTLLQCSECDRYIVRGDTDRHIRQTHDGQQVEWQETR